VALQGSIETFALPDVLRLLGSTSKTGRLRLSGSRGSGSMWVTDGKLVAGEASNAAVGGVSDVLFELLRFDDGDFSFDQDETHPSPVSPVEVEDTLTEAESMLDEWKGLKSVVPSLDAWVSLQADLSGESITIPTDRWRSIVTVAGGMSVAQLGVELELGELPVMREVRDLLDLGVVVVGEAPAGAPAPAVAPPATAPAPEAPTLETEPAPAPEPEQPAAAEAAPEEAFESFDPSALMADSDDAAPADTGGFAGLDEPASDESTFAGLDDAPAAPSEAPAAAAADTPMDAKEIAQQLANLSPKAAKAVAAAAKATTKEERDAALDGLGDEDGAINRDLLLKFLGSVNS
jgi:hypothetical protein